LFDCLVYALNSCLCLSQFILVQSLPLISCFLSLLVELRLDLGLFYFFDVCL